MAEEITLWVQKIWPELFCYCKNGRYVFKLLIELRIFLVNGCVAVYVDFLFIKGLNAFIFKLMYQTGVYSSDIWGSLTNVTITFPMITELLDEDTYLIAVLAFMFYTSTYLNTFSTFKNMSDFIYHTIYIPYVHILYIYIIVHYLLITSVHMYLYSLIYIKFYRC